MKFLIVALLSFISFSCFSQIRFGRVIDSRTKSGLPFATIKINDGKQGAIADLNGYFNVENVTTPFTAQATYLGYNNLVKSIKSTDDSIIFLLNENNNTLNEFVVKPPYEKIRRILNHAIANRPKNNPDNYDWYRCHVYYKMVFDLTFQDSVLKKLEKDTSKDGQFFLWYAKSQDVFMTETYSIRTWKKPQQLQEEILASKMSGFKTSLFSSLVTDMLPFHSYTDYLTLNGKDYHNPIAKGWQQRYDFNIADEIWNENDTVWVLSFRPKNQSITPLRGRVYIHSDGFAISNMLAQTRDTSLKRTIKVEQQYQQVNGKWFPKELNYILQFDRQQIDKAVKSKDSTKRKSADTMNFSIVVIGNSKIDSVSFDKDEHFRFDNMHTIQLATHADDADEKRWEQLRSIPLTPRETRTYIFNDSLFKAEKIDRLIPYLQKLTEAKIPFKFFDLNLDRVLSFNKYEHTRWGLGLETNESLSKRFSFGGWAGYGTGDQEWKYGGFTEYYFDKHKDCSFNISYENILREPGRILLSKEIDYNYIHLLLMNKADAITSYSFAFKKRMGYWNAELGGRYEDILPKYPYQYAYQHIIADRFTNKEINLKLRYAFAERRVPMFNKYYNSGTKYPIVYAKLTVGNLSINEHDIFYTQTIGSVYWHKHINRIGNENFLLMAAKSWSDEPLPLSKLFAANGFKYEQNNSLYFFGGINTMQASQYFSDRFFSFCWKHDFDRRFYDIGFSAPYLSIAHNILWGNMNFQSAQQLADFKIANNVYQESGLILNSFLRIKYAGLYYLTTNIGYFVHLTSEMNLKENGTFVMGASIDF